MMFFYEQKIIKIVKTIEITQLKHISYTFNALIEISYLLESKKVSTIQAGYSN